MNKKDASIQRREVSTEIINKNSSVIKNLDFKILDFTEKNLDYYEKVSLMFLLCAADQTQRDFILNELISQSTQPTGYLQRWAKKQTDWKDPFLESLCLIQANWIIFQLGLDIDELFERYLPSNLYVSDYIHGTVKKLYKMCEDMEVNDCRALVDYMEEHNPKLKTMKWPNHGEYLELHLMHWISMKIISLDSSNGSESSNLQPLTEYFKLHEMDKRKEIISNASIQANASKLINMPANESQTDNNRNTIIDECPRSIEYLRLQDTKLAKYSIRRGKAGIMLIINQKEFVEETDPDLIEHLPAKKLDKRDGTDQDEKKLFQVFTALNFKVVIRSNLKHSEIYNEIKKIVEACESYDSVFICILSHGCDGAVYGHNSIPVEIEEIKHQMVSNASIGKPKVLIIQACQGTETQRAIFVNRLETDGNEKYIPKRCIPYCDFVTCLASVRGFSSFRHTDNGSWFIQTLCETIIEKSDEMHFVDILTLVQKKVQEKRGRNNECMVPEFSSTLGGSLYLPKIDKTMLSDFNKAI